MTSAAQAANVVARLLARTEERAVTIRETRQLADDPTAAFGIATIKMVSEEVVQAVAFGRVDRSPEIVVRWNPLSRDAGGLEVLGVALDRYLRDMVEADEMPRVWVPHKSALTILEVLGHRYRTNREATDNLRTLGRHCITLATEARFKGQQAVVVAGDVLRDHVATGQSPVEDGHLGALLAWVDPPSNRSVIETAELRARIPASGVLPRDADDRVEALRRIGKGDDIAGAAARAEIEAILTAGVIAEWDLLLSARRAVLGLPLPVTPGMSALVKASRERLAYRIVNEVAPPSRPVALARMVEEYGYAEEIAEDVAVRGDSLAREKARAKGRVISGSVVSVRWGRSPGFMPCALVVRTEQPVLRVRRGTVLRTLDGGVVSRVADELEDGGARVLELDVTSGVRAVKTWSLPTDVELTDTYPQDFKFVRDKARRAMTAANTPLVFSDTLDPAPVASPPSTDLLARARALRLP